jgi:hypothetical protein
MAALTGSALPEPAPADLPEGLFVAEKGPFWLEHGTGGLTWLGATDRLFKGDDGTAVTRSAHLPVRLRRLHGSITGEIGHVERKLVPVASDAALAKSWEGEWACEQHRARCRIERSNGSVCLTIGTGPLCTTLQLTPLDAYRALIDRRDGPWRQRACLLLNPRARTLRMVTNRSRVLQFGKA